MTALDIGGKGGVVDGVPYEPSATAVAFFTTGTLATFSVPSVLSPPVADAAKSEMIHSSAYGSDFEIDLSIDPGTYTVFAYVWQQKVVSPAVPVRYNVSVGVDQVETEKDSGGTGDWAKLGPWVTTVVPSAQLHVRLWTRTSEVMFVSGVEVWKAQ